MKINLLFGKKETLSKKSTFSEFIYFYFDNIAKLKYSELTYIKNKGVVYSKLLPKVGIMKLEEITPIFVSKFINNLAKEKKLSLSTINRIKATFSSVMQSAVELGILIYNPCKNIKINYLDSGRKSYKYYNQATYIKVLNLLQKEDLMHRAIIELALKTGLRKSEIFGLTWQDVNFSDCTISINKSRNYITHLGYIVKSTKNKSSNRIICISKNLCHLLHYLKQCYPNNSYIFEMLNINTVTWWFKNWQIKNGIDPIRFHDLRHSHATLLLSQGVDIKTISNRLGHSSITTTLNIYTHALHTLDKSAAEKLEEINIKKEAN